VFDTGVNLSIGNVFTLFDNITVQGAEGEAGIAYKVYIYVPSVAYPSSTTFTVTI
jgi:hypothetical protein